MPAANVLYITVDQWRGDCLGAAGHPVVQTPNLDRLASRGVRFANHWSVTAPCGPSRASLHTGLYMMNHRSVNNGTPLDDRFTNIAREARALGYDPTLFGYTDTSVDPRTVTDPEDPRLRDYEGVLPGFTPGTILTWHNMAPWLEWLEGHGHTLPDTWEELFEAKPGFPGAEDHGSTWAPSRFPAEHTETAFMTERVIEWLDRRDDEPWFAHVSYIRPHPPYRAPEGYHDRYDPDDGPPFKRLADRDAELAMHPIQAAGAHITKAPVDERELRQLRATYWGNMTEVDDQLGRLFGHLDELGLTDDRFVRSASIHIHRSTDRRVVRCASRRALRQRFDRDTDRHQLRGRTLHREETTTDEIGDAGAGHDLRCAQHGDEVRHLQLRTGRDDRRPVRLGDVHTIGIDRIRQPQPM